MWVALVRREREREEVINGPQTPLWKRRRRRDQPLIRLFPMGGKDDGMRGGGERLSPSVKCGIDDGRRSSAAFPSLQDSLLLSLWLLFSFLNREKSFLRTETNKKKNAALITSFSARKCFAWEKKVKDLLTKRFLKFSS